MSFARGTQSLMQWGYGSRVSRKTIADDIFKYILWNEKHRFVIQISLIFVPIRVQLTMSLRWSR